MKKQMKKMLSVLLMLSLLAIIAIPVMAKDDNVWTLDQSVDDFGDANGDYIIKTVVNGTFSNTATTNSDLKVFAYFLLDDKGVFGRKGAYILALRLLEYGEYPATYLSSDNMELKTKIGDTVDSYELCGSITSADICVKYTENNTKPNYAEVIAKQLVDGNDIRCVVKIGASKYNFTLESGNIKDIFTTVTQDGTHEMPQDIDGQIQRSQEQQQKVEEQADLETQQRAEEYAKSFNNLINILMKGDSSGIEDAVPLRKEYIKNHMDELKTLSEEELNSFSPGTYIFYSINAGDNLGFVYSFDETGNGKLIGLYHSDGSFEEDTLDSEVWKTEDSKIKCLKAADSSLKDEYDVLSMGIDGYYWLQKYTNGTPNEVTRLIVQCDENYKPLYELSE